MALGKEVLSRNQTLQEGLDNVVRFVRAGNTQKASVIIDPPALGRISLELSHGTSGLEASIKVSNEQVRQLIQDQLSQLRHSLAQQGVQLTNFSVDVQQDDSHERQGTPGHNSKRAQGLQGESGSEDEETTFRVDLNQGLLYWVA